jgi:hypothetical protein
MGLLNKFVTTLGITIILFYSVTKILKFYGVGEEVYGYYLAFYVFLIITYFILPSSYPKP